MLTPLRLSLAGTSSLSLLGLQVLCAPGTAPLWSTLPSFQQIKGRPASSYQHHVLAEVGAGFSLPGNKSLGSWEVRAWSP